MKKIILILAGAFCISAAAVQAQDVAPRDTTNKSVSSSPSVTHPSEAPSQDYKQDMVKIKSSEVPASLRSTLQGTQYKGWEKATIYRSKNNDGYVIEMKDASDKIMTHRFDANGKPLRDN